MRGFAGLKTKGRGRRHEKEAPAAISGNDLHGSGQLKAAFLSSNTIVARTAKGNMGKAS